MKKLITATLTWGALLVSSAAQGHEFWLQPNHYTAKPGDSVHIDWRVGSYFVGESLVYLPNLAAQTGYYANGQKTELRPRFASKPALVLTMPEADSVIVYTETTDFTVTYPNIDAFADFLTKERLNHFMPASLPEVAGSVQESYRRYAKTYLMSDGQAFRDVRLGMTYEWVLEAEDNGVAGQLWLEQEPAANHPVTLFYRNDTGEVTTEARWTDADGRVRFTALMAGVYLINAVMITESDVPDIPWHTLWASVVFQR